jgi:hypothetical protein
MGRQQEKEVADRLRREIVASRPQFSHELHVKVRHAVAEYRANRAATLSSRRWREWSSYRWPIVGAACVLVVVCVALSVDSFRGPAPVPSTIASRAKLSLGHVLEFADRAAAKTGAVAAEAMAAQRWAYLDHDARAVLAAPAARLPLDVISSLLSSHRPNRSRSSNSQAVLPVADGNPVGTAVVQGG